MTLIRIVSGNYGARPAGGRLTVITKGNTVEVPDDEAARLVNLGVAAYVKEPVLMAETVPAPVSEDAPSDTPDEEVNEAPEAHEESLEDMPFEQLKQLAKESGLPVGKLRSRTNIIKALQELEDGDKPPSMDAEDVVV